MNGNNIKEYYISARSWIQNFNLSSREIKKLNQHIYKCWVSQNDNNMTKFLSRNVFKIFPYTISQDKKVLLRFLKSLINK
jgi:hypothetical protein